MIVSVPNSAVEGVVWPAFPNSIGLILLAVLQQLDQSQWWPAEVLLEQQWRQLQVLTQHAAQTVPFYRRWFEIAGFDPSQSLNRERWQQLPILTRDQVQAAGQDILSQQIPAGHGKTYRLVTSGSTGQPLEVCTTQLAQIFNFASQIREHHWHGRDLSHKLANIRDFKSHGIQEPCAPQGHTSSNWGVPFKLLYTTGPAASLDIRPPLSALAAWLQGQNPHYLLTYPSYLEGLLRYCDLHQFRLPNLLQVRTISESLDPDVREMCRQIWGVEVVDGYSCTEFGWVASQCPECEQYHVQSESVLVEILNDNNQPCAPGQPGRLVITGLHNFAMPLLRYEIGDYAIPGDPCVCGRGLPVLHSILGRQKNLVTLPNGEQFFPFGMFKTEAGKLAPILQWQIVQTELERLEAYLITERPLTNEEEAAITASLQKWLHYPFAIEFHYIDAVPHPNGKFESFISKING